MKFRTRPRGRRTAQSIVQRQPQTMRRNRRDRDPRRLALQTQSRQIRIQSPQICKQPRSRLAQIALRREIPSRRRRIRRLRIRPKAQPSLARRRRRRVKANPRPRRVMARQTPRRQGRLLISGGGRQNRSPRDRLQILQSQTARTQQARLLAFDQQNRGFHSHRTSPRVDHRADAASEPLQHMIRIRRTHGARTIRARTNQRSAESLQQSQRHRMVRDANPHPIPARRRRLRKPRLGAQLQNHGQRTGPKNLAQTSRQRRKLRQTLRRRQRRRMGDQWIIRGTTLRPVNRRHRPIRTRVRAEPINRLRRKGHQPPRPQNPRRRRDPPRPRAQAHRIQRFHDIPPRMTRRPCCAAAQTRHDRRRGIRAS